MSTFYSGAGSKLAAGLQSSYFNNSSTSVNTKLNITSATFDPSVEKISEETLLQSKVKNGSLLASITMDASFDANLRPEMSDWIFSATCQQIGDSTTTSTTGYVAKNYTLKAAGNDPLGSTLVLTKGDQVTTYPGMTVRSMTMTMPNNDFVTVSGDLAGREEIRGIATYQATSDSVRVTGKLYFTRSDQEPYTYTVYDGTDLEGKYELATGTSAIGGNAVPVTSYMAKEDESSDYTKSSYIVTRGIFEWNDNVWCIESSTLTIDNGIEDSPRCYQDGKYANIPVMGMRSITFDFNTPYDARIETLKEDYLLTSQYGKAEVEFTNADDENEKIIVTIPNLSITSVSAGISGTGVIDASISGEAVQDNGEEPLTIFVQTKNS